MKNKIRNYQERKNTVKTSESPVALNATKRVLTGLMLAVAVMFMGHDAMAAQAPVALGSADTFAVLAATTVTSTGATTVDGDLGVSPGTGLTGAPIVNGVTHLGDATAGQAQGDLTTAYNDAAGRSVGAVSEAGNLGGLTLAPGLYKSTSSLEISSGDLTLDAQGDTNAVWIFQMASSFVTTTGRQIILSGGAQAANIYWQVGSSATLGSSSVFKGNILALASITVTTGATVEGRLLARTGGVSLDSNPVGLAGIGSTPTPWPDATNLGGGNWSSSWFGDFNVTFYPWIYHAQHGSMYTFGSDPASIWLWTTDMGFVWTGSGVYPWLWRNQDGTWIYYAKGSQSPRWFFNWNTQTWESHNP